MSYDSKWNVIAKVFRKIQQDGQGHARLNDIVNEFFVTEYTTSAEKKRKKREIQENFGSIRTAWKRLWSNSPPPIPVGKYFFNTKDSKMEATPQTHESAIKHRIAWRSEEIKGIYFPSENNNVYLRCWNGMLARRAKGACDSAVATAEKYNVKNEDTRKLEGKAPRQIEAPSEDYNSIGRGMFEAMVIDLIKEAKGIVGFEDPEEEEEALIDLVWGKVDELDFTKRVLMWCGIYEYTPPLLEFAGIFEPQHFFVDKMPEEIANIVVEVFTKATATVFVFRWYLRQNLHPLTALPMTQDHIKAFDKVDERYWQTLNSAIESL